MMFSRNPFQHSYVPYTGKPYIYYNGVPINIPTNYVDNSEPDRYFSPQRTIIRSRLPDNISPVNRSVMMEYPNYREYTQYLRNYDVANNY